MARVGAAAFEELVDDVLLEADPAVAVAVVDIDELADPEEEVAELRLDGLSVPHFPSAALHAAWAVASPALADSQIA